MDNLGRIAEKTSAGENIASEAWERFGAVGLNLHEVTRMGTWAWTGAGRELTRDTQHRQAKFAIRSALGDLLKRRRVGGWEQEKLLAHATHFSGVREGTAEHFQLSSRAETLRTAC